jgi:hypothetical protein
LTGVELDELRLVLIYALLENWADRVGTYIHIIELVLIVAPDRVVEVIPLSDDADGFVGVIFMEFACIISLSDTTELTA